MKILIKEYQYEKTIKKLILEDIDLSSFKVQDILSPDIFDENDKMIPEVRKVLLQVGKDFYDYMGIPWVDLQDIILTGSLANYNWSKFSDVDLHVVIPYKQISKNADLVDEFTWAKKDLWNSEHDIKIKDYEVEMYAQDVEDDLVAGGIYSVLYDKWIKKPERFNVNLNSAKIEKIVDFFEDKINDIFKSFLAGDTYGLIDDIDDLKGALRALRKRGLTTDGEFSAENIAYKALRRMGLLDKLNDVKDDIYDDSLSIEKSRAEKADDGELEKKRPEEREKDKENDDEIEGKGKYMIQGRRFNSLRKAAKVLGIPKSTIEYRLKSDNPEFSQYREMPN